MRAGPLGFRKRRAEESLWSPDLHRSGKLATRKHVTAERNDGGQYGMAGDSAWRHDTSHPLGRHVDTDMSTLATGRVRLAPLGAEVKDGPMARLVRTSSSSSAHGHRGTTEPQSPPWNAKPVAPGIVATIASLRSRLSNLPRLRRSSTAFRSPHRPGWS